MFANIHIISTSYLVLCQPSGKYCIGLASYCTCTCTLCIEQCETIATSLGKPPSVLSKEANPKFRYCHHF